MAWASAARGYSYIRLLAGQRHHQASFCPVLPSSPPKHILIHTPLLQQVPSSKYSNLRSIALGTYPEATAKQTTSENCSGVFSHLRCSNCCLHAMNVTERRAIRGHGTCSYHTATLSADYFTWCNRSHSVARPHTPPLAPVHVSEWCAN